MNNLNSNSNDDDLTPSALYNFKLKKVKFIIINIRND